MTDAERAIDDWYREQLLQMYWRGVMISPDLAPRPKTLAEKLRPTDESREIDQEYKKRHQALIDERKRREQIAAKERERENQSDRRR